MFDLKSGRSMVTTTTVPDRHRSPNNTNYTKRGTSQEPGDNITDRQQTRTSQAKPSQAKPSQAKPSQAKPSQAKPSQAKPHPGNFSVAPVENLDSNIFCIHQKWFRSACIHVECIPNTRGQKNQDGSSRSIFFINFLHMEAMFCLLPAV